MNAATIPHPRHELARRVSGGIEVALFWPARGGTGKTTARSKTSPPAAPPGAVGGFLVASGLAEANTTIVLRQGRSLGRPSEMHVRVHSDAGATSNVEVAGPVAILAHGVLRLPERAQCLGTDSQEEDFSG
jgi:hypothetical protein